MVFIRTCQECGHQQKDKDLQGAPTLAFYNRKCKKCKSESLDYGSEQPETEAEKAAALKFMEDWSA
jgi:hypothetical protein